MTTSEAVSPSGDRILLCFSHLRWNFVFQRPQHLMTRASRTRHVYFIEEPVFVDDTAPASPSITNPRESVTVVVPVISNERRADATSLQREIVSNILAQHPGADVVAWFYTPMALAISEHAHADITVYDCMDELTGFLGAPPELSLREQSLFRKADLVFTGGRSLYEAKRKQHSDAHLFPSSIDKQHFTPARDWHRPKPADQAAITGPRIGFFGVIDERMNLDLVDALARLRPDWQFIMLGPVVKIDEAHMPRYPNLHWLGMKTYAELPAYLAGWNAGIMPFALNDATRYISPTKTPEFLAAGVPVVSTPIVDVVETYGKTGLIEIAGSATEFASALERQMSRDKQEWLASVDAFLATQSWDETWVSMQQLIDKARTGDTRLGVSVHAA